MVSTTLTGCSIGNDNSEVSVNDNNDITYKDAENEELIEVISKAVNAGSSNAKKEETVYVKTDASGTVNSVVVSSWLKNVDNTEELTDYTQLTDITNIKGKETYTEEAGKILQPHMLF